MDESLKNKIEELTGNELIEVLALIKTRTLASLDGLSDITEEDDLLQLEFIKNSEGFLNESNDRWAKLLRIISYED